MLNRLEVMTTLNDMYSEKLQKIGFSTNKGKNTYKLKNEMGEYIFYFKFDRKNSLHLQFTYTHPTIGKKLLEIENTIVNYDDTLKSQIKPKVQARPTIVISDWIDFISDNNFDYMTYNKWLLKIHTIEDVLKTKNTYELIFDLVHKNIINKINNNENLYDYLEAIKHKNHKDFQNLLILSSLLNNKDINKVYSEIKKTNSYQQMIKSFADDVDSTFNILKEDNS